jgi:hypothetical protein
MKDVRIVCDILAIIEINEISPAHRPVRGHSSEREQR